MYLSSEQLQSPILHQPIRTRPATSLLEHGSSELNEDVLLETDNLYGVFDGSTSLDKRRFQDGLTGGLLAASTAAKSFQHSRLPLRQTAENANKNILQAQLCENVDVTNRHLLWSTSLAVIRLEENYFEYCQTGDALILLILENGNYRLVTPDIDIDQETLQLLKRAKASADVTLQADLEQQIRKVRLEMNESYGVLNGEPEALRFINHGYEDLANVSDILIFTDGLHLPRENPQEEHDWSSFVKLFRSGGLRAIRDFVRETQGHDPDCSKYPRFKCHDDIAAVALNCSLPSHRPC